MNIPQDTVQVAFSVEDFVTADSVKIEVTAFAVVPEGSVDIKAKIMDALDKAQPGAKWSITGMDRNTNDTGQEQVTATATSRIADKDLNGLGKRIVAASYPGLKLKHSHTDYAPRQAQIDEAVRKLRTRVYERANEEVDDINAVVKGTFEWRVGGISVSMQDDHSNVRSPKGGMRAMAMTASLESAGGAYGGSEDEDSMNLTRKLVMYATVTLARKVYAEI